jgi:hypothetical protein
MEVIIENVYFDPAFDRLTEGRGGACITTTMQCPEKPALERKFSAVYIKSFPHAPPSCLPLFTK